MSTLERQHGATQAVRRHGSVNQPPAEEPSGDQLWHKALTALGGPALRLHRYRAVHRRLLHAALASGDRSLGHSRDHLQYDPKDDLRSRVSKAKSSEEQS